MPAKQGLYPLGYISASFRDSDIIFQRLLQGLFIWNGSFTDHTAGRSARRVSV